MRNSIFQFSRNLLSGSNFSIFSKPNQICKRNSQFNFFHTKTSRSFYSTTAITDAAKKYVPGLLIGAVVIPAGVFTLYEYQQKSPEDTLMEHLKEKLDTYLDSHPYWSGSGSTKLLPEALPPPYGRPYTLVIDLDLLISIEETRSGKQIKKRPGADFFLSYVGQFYELVLFTEEPFGRIIAIVEKLDQGRFFQHKLFRDATERGKKGVRIKDLSYLNRDLSKVVVLDHKQDSIERQSENAIIIPKWEGQVPDTTLLDILPTLRDMGGSGAPDIRMYIKLLKESDPEKKKQIMQMMQLEIQKNSAKQKGALSGALH